MDNKLLEFGILSFVSLFTMINPLGIIPVFATMTGELSPEETRRVAYKAVLLALFLLTGFALAGQAIFRFFAISVNSLRIVGGVIFFMVGYEMLQARLTRTKHDSEDHDEFVNDIAITPLAIPIICGPGAITTVIIMMSESHDLPHKAILLSAITAVLLITLLLLLGAERVMAFLGESGKKVLMRVMGLIVMVIAVEFFFSGLRPILRDILMLK